jgi:amino acid adenylation domain-containing protein
MRISIGRTPDEVEALGIPAVLIAWSEATGKTIRVATLPAKLCQSVQELGERVGVPPSEILLAAVQTLLHRYTSNEEISVRVISADASGSGSLRTVRLSFGDDPQFLQLLSRSRVAGAALATDAEAESESEERARFPGLASVLFGFGGHSVSLAGTESSDLAIWVAPENADWQVLFLHSLQRFDGAMIERMQAHFASLLAGALAMPRQRISALPLLTEAERETVLTSWNATERRLPREPHIVRLFEEQVERTPDSTAAVFGARRISYRDLNRRANQLARLLTREGVGSDSVVGLLVERGIDPLAAILGVFKAGGAYLPLDPAHPVARTREIIERSGVRIALAGSALTPRLSEAGESSGLRVIPLDSSTAAREGGENVPRTGSPGDLAYIIFTSGSTGSPKGAMLEHRGMLNHLIAKVDDLGLTGADVIAQTASQCFDISVWQLLAGLLVGARIVIFEDEIAHDPMRLLDGLQKEEISVVEVVPSMLSAMLETVANSSPPNLPALRWMIATGEALPPALVREWFHSYPDVPMLNAYGPTECSDDVTHYMIRIPPSDGETQIPIGRPIANTQLYIVDPAGSPVPVGIAGELRVGGAGVGRGYRNDPARTAEAFMPDPFRPGVGARLYKTGDLARYRPDGNIEFLGRIDHQVKIRGFRIELGELESVLARHPSVKACVVVALPDSNGEKRLVAYLVAKDPGATPAALRTFLKESLPDYMLPSAFVVLDALPLTPNGKVDRKALPASEPSAEDFGREHVKPTSERQRRLAEIWSNVLGVRSVGIRDDFFELGGNSLSAARLAIQVESTLGKKMSPARLLEAPTIERLELVLDEEEQPTQLTSLIPIQPGGSEPPLFCMHAGAGTILFYHDLARELGSDQPVYALQAQGLYGMLPPESTVEEMAAHYIREMRTVQPEGPYALAGFCFGAILAFEVAQQLRAQEQEIRLLASFDGPAPHYDYSADPSESIPRSASARLSRFWSQFRALTLRQRTSFLRRKLEDHWLYRTRNIQYRIGEWFRSKRRPVPATIRRVYFLRNHWEAENKYRPKVYPGGMVVLRSEGVFHDPKLGWEDLVAGGLEIYPVSGEVRGHRDLMTSKFIRGLMPRLKSLLRSPERRSAGVSDISGPHVVHGGIFPIQS